VRRQKIKKKWGGKGGPTARSEKKRGGGGGGDLEPRLDAYEAQARAVTAKRLARWPAYAAAVGSGLAFATAADAGIIYSGPQNVTVTVNNGPGTRDSFRSAPIKMDLAGPVDFNLECLFRRGARFTTGKANLETATGNGGLMSNASGRLKRLASGAVISAGKGFSTSASTLVEPFGQFGVQSNTKGTWPKSVTGFAGVEFKISGQFHFGWVRLEWLDTNNTGVGGKSGFPNEVKAIDWAYNDVAGAPIAAGQGIPAAAPPIPEPGTLSLMLLAMGSAGVLAWRKRRQQAAT